MNEITAAEQSHALEESLRWAVGQAVLAPSPHNTQPWRFRIREATIELIADHARSLPVVDPDDRELVMSCGMVLFFLRTALRARGFGVEVSRLPDTMEQDLIAQVEVGPGLPPTEEEQQLFAAIAGRRTAREPYLGITVPDDLIDRLRRDVEAEGAWFVPLTSETDRLRLAALVMEADHEQWSTREFREEFGRWMRPNDSKARDGIFGYSFGLDNVESHLLAMSVRLIDRGSREAIHDRDLVDASPLLAIIGTVGDTLLDWIRAGEALGCVLLRAEGETLRVAPLNQPIESSELRPFVAEMAGRPGAPQSILRIGYGNAGPGAPRRALADFLE